MSAINSRANYNQQTKYAQALSDLLKNDSFKIYRLYNLDFGEDKNLKTSIQTTLNNEYKALLSIEKFFYSIWHFLEAYAIFPILGDKDEFEESEKFSDHEITLDNAQILGEDTLSTDSS